MRDEPIIRRQIHTVLLCGSKKQGVALGKDGETGQAIRIWLLTPKAVELALKQLAAFGNACGRTGHLHVAGIQRLRARRLNVRAKEWALR